MRRILLLPLALLAVLVVAAPASATTSLAQLRGDWAGTLIDKTPRIDVAVTLSGGQKGSTIAFTGGIVCSGTLIYGGRRGERFSFTERITTSATDRCGGLGVVRLRLRADGRLRYTWQAIGADIPPATAVLERVVLEG